jgi:hypothetical protein
MSDILDEIKESINEKKTNQVLIRSTISIFILGILIITYLGISSWYESKKNEKIQAEGALLTQIANNINVSKVNNKTPDEKKLIEEKNKSQIQKLEKLAEQNSSAYSALANIYLASISLMDSNHSKALYYYQRISKDASFSQTLQEYAKLIEINTKLQYSPSIYETPLKQLDEYFAEYVKPDNTIDIKLLNNKSFSNAMALTAIATNDINDNNSKSKLYLEVLKQYEKPNDNIKFIIASLAKYIEQKQ